MATAVQATPRMSFNRLSTFPSMSRRALRRRSAAGQVSGPAVLSGSMSSRASLGAVGRWMASAAGALLLVAAGLAAGCGGAEVKPAAVRPDSPVHRVPHRAGVVVIVRDGDSGDGSRAPVCASAPIARGRMRTGSRRCPCAGAGGSWSRRPRAITRRAGSRWSSTSAATASFPSTGRSSSGPCTERRPSARRRTPRSPCARRSAFVWRRRIGFLEFPAVVFDGVAYVSNLSGTVRALWMRTGTCCGAGRRRGRSRPRPRSSARSLSPTGWTAASACSTATRPAALAVPRRLPDRVLAGRRRRASTTSARGTGTSTRSTSAARLRWSSAPGRRSPRASPSPEEPALRRRLRRPRLGALPAQGPRRWRGSVGGRVYGTPAVANGRVFVPSSTGRSLTAFRDERTPAVDGHTGAYVYSSPAVWGGRVFFGSHNGVLYCVSARNGRTLWTYASGRADLRGADRRRAGRLLRQHGPADLRAGRAHRPPADDVPRRELRARLGQRGKAAAARLLPLYAVAPR